MRPVAVATRIVPGLGAYSRQGSGGTFVGGRARGQAWIHVWSLLIPGPSLGWLPWSVMAEINSRAKMRKPCKSAALEEKRPGMMQLSPVVVVCASQWRLAGDIYVCMYVPHTGSELAFFALIRQALDGTGL